MQPDGKIVAGGYGRLAAFGWELARFNADGSLDGGFGGTGIVTPPVTGNIFSVARQSDGKIVAAGLDSSSSSSAQFGLGRFNTDGSLDTAFGGDGLVWAAIGSSSIARGVAVQADGKIVAAGSTPENSSSASFALARYLGDSVAPAAGIADVPLGTAPLAEPAELMSTLDAVAVSLVLEQAQRPKG